MKTLSRDFTSKEKVLLLVLALLLLALSYYRFLWMPTNESMDRAVNRRDDLQAVLTTTLLKEARLKKMQNELDSLGKLELASRMGSYNNSKAELSLLNSVLEAADSYYISFTNVTRDGDQIRRNFNLLFTADNFAQVKQIIQHLTESEYRCLLGDMRYSVETRQGAKNYGKVTVETAATFFETMYDGVPDAGLPAEEGQGAS